MNMTVKAQIGLVSFDRQSYSTAANPPPVEESVQIGAEWRRVHHLDGSVRLSSRWQLLQFVLNRFHLA